MAFLPRTLPVDLDQALGKAKKEIKSKLRLTLVEREAGMEARGVGGVGGGGGVFLFPFSREKVSSLQRIQGKVQNRAILVSCDDVGWAVGRGRLHFAVCRRSRLGVQWQDGHVMLYPDGVQFDLGADGAKTQELVKYLKGEVSKGRHKVQLMLAS